MIIFVEYTYLQRKIRKLKDKLLQIIEPRCGLLEELINLDVISSAECDQIENRGDPIKMNDVLLSIISQTPLADKLDSFITALDNSHQMHVTNFLNSNGSKWNNSNWSIAWLSLSHKYK